MTVSDLSPQQATDARLSPRANVSWAAKIVMGPQTYLDARVINASADGLGLVCEKALPEGAMMQVVVAMPDPADRSKYHYPTVHLKVAHHIVKGAKFRIGTRFTKIDPATKAMMDLLVQKVG